MDVEESGERHLEMGFAERYTSAGEMENAKGEKVQRIGREKDAIRYIIKGKRYRRWMLW